jgi:hypothetical protein
MNRLTCIASERASEPTRAAFALETLARYGDQDGGPTVRRISRVPAVALAKPGESAWGSPRGAAFG